jgi:hypothetical protein
LMEGLGDTISPWLKWLKIPDGVYKYIKQEERKKKLENINGV